MIGNVPSAPVTTVAESVSVPEHGSPGGRHLLVAIRSTLRAMLQPLLAMLTALIFCAVLLLVTGHNPWTVYDALWTGAVTGPASFAETLVSTTPYILLGLAVAVGFKGGLFN